MHKSAKFYYQTRISVKVISQSVIRALRLYVFKCEHTAHTILTAFSLKG